MSADPIIVAILIILGLICGLVLSIVPTLVNKLGPYIGKSVSRVLNAICLGAYVGIGWWVHYQRGVSYPREYALYMQKVAADEVCKYCPAPIDGRHAWLLFWIVAGLVAYAVRPSGRHLVLARRAVGATLALLGVGVTWFSIETASGKPHEVLVALLFAEGFIATGIAIARRAAPPHSATPSPSSWPPPQGA
jgi:hypothetical protein